MMSPETSNRLLTRFLGSRNFNPETFKNWAASAELGSLYALVFKIESVQFRHMSEIDSLEDLQSFRIFDCFGEFRGRLLDSGQLRVVYSGQFRGDLKDFDDCQEQLSCDLVNCEIKSHWIDLWGRRTARDPRLIERQIPRELEFPMSGNGRAQVEIETWHDSDIGTQFWSRWRAVGMSGAVARDKQKTALNDVNPKGQ